MPVGNGLFAANVWADNATGTINALISSSAAWSEAGELLKVGLVSVAVTPNPFGAGPFSQVFDIATGTVTFTTPTMSASVVMAADTNVLLFSVTSSHDVVPTVVPIRPNATVATPAFDCQAYTTSADVIQTGAGGTVFYHKNPSAADAAAANQSYFQNVVAG